MMNDRINRNCPGRFQPVGLFFIYAVIGCVLACIAVAQSNRTRPTPLSDQVIVDPEHPQWLKRQGGSHLFLCGPGDPEGFLYRGKRNQDGTRDGDQMRIIDNLARHGGNTLYLIAVRTHGGDAWKDKRDDPAVYPDDLHNPWFEQDPKKGLNEAILKQWDAWLTELDRHKIVVFFFIFDDAIDVTKQFGWALDAQGNLHPEEKVFVQSLVNRFEHHRNLVWCVMEEGQEIGADWQRHISKIAEAIREADDHRHPIASHQLGGNVFFHADDPNIDQFAIQTRGDRVVTRETFHEWLVEAWRNSAGRYGLNMSEDMHHHQLCESGDRAGVRQRNWAAAMAGTYIMVFGIDGARTPAEWMQDCRRLQQFFESTDFYRMGNADELNHGETEFVLAAPGRSYIIYSAGAKKSLGLKSLPAGEYDLRWFDCVTGQRIEQIGLRLGRGDQSWPKPQGLGSEVALYLKRHGRETRYTEAKTIAKREAGSSSISNRAVIVADKTYRTQVNTPVDLQLAYTDPDGGPGPYIVSIIVSPKSGVLSGAGNDLTYTPRRGFVGKDSFTWRVNDGGNDSTIATVTIRVERARAGGND
jgi:Big-like domain-containing protein